MVRPKPASHSWRDLYFYQTVWFYALVLFVVVLGSAGVLVLQERQARARYNLRLTERTRIAREMHDTVVQGCIGVSTLIEAAVSSAGSDQDSGMMECLDNARIHLRMTLDEARQALSDLRHDSFDNGLAGALSELAQSVTRDKDILAGNASSESEGPDAYLPEIVNRSLLLVAREAIRNAVGHGRSDDCERTTQFRARPVSAWMFKTTAADLTLYPAQALRPTGTSESSVCANEWNR